MLGLVERLREEEGGEYFSFEWAEQKSEGGRAAMWKWLLQTVRRDRPNIDLILNLTSPDAVESRAMTLMLVMASGCSLSERTKPAA